MSWLNAIPKADRRAIVAELAQRLSDEPTLKTAWETAVERVLERHGFKQPHSATSVAHNIMAENTERDRHAARMLALSNLISLNKSLCNTIRRSLDTPNTTVIFNSAELIKVELAIASVEREFKP